MNPICVPCKRLYVTTKTGARVHFENNYLKSGDMLTCPGCFHQMITNFGNGYRDCLSAPLAELQVDPNLLSSPIPLKDKQ